MIAIALELSTYRANTVFTVIVLTCCGKLLCRFITAYRTGFGYVTVVNTGCVFPICNTVIMLAGRGNRFLNFAITSATGLYNLTVSYASCIGARGFYIIVLACCGDYFLYSFATAVTFLNDNTVVNTSCFSSGNLNVVMFTGCGNLILLCSSASRRTNVNYNAILLAGCRFNYFKVTEIVILNVDTVTTIALLPVLVRVGHPSESILVNNLRKRLFVNICVRFSVINHFSSVNLFTFCLASCGSGLYGYIRLFLNVMAFIISTSEYYLCLAMIITPNERIGVIMTKRCYYVIGILILAILTIVKSISGTFASRSNYSCVILV